MGAKLSNGIPKGGLVALAEGGNLTVTGPIPGIPTIVPTANFTSYDFVEE